MRKKTTCLIQKLSESFYYNATQTQVFFARKINKLEKFKHLNSHSKNKIPYSIYKYKILNINMLKKIEH
jgi:hypothetical protein